MNIYFTTTQTSQAHVRGHQVRKKYIDILWTVGVAEKAILRWRRKGCGLRGFHHESDAMDDTEQDDDEDDDILKAFRKIKVDETIKSAVSRVMSMLDFPEAQTQYRRVFDNYLQFKVGKKNHFRLDHPSFISNQFSESRFSFFFLQSEPVVSDEATAPECSTLLSSQSSFMSMFEDWLNME